MTCWITIRTSTRDPVRWWAAEAAQGLEVCNTRMDLRALV